MTTSITTDIATKGIAFRFLTGGDLLTVEATGSLTSTANVAIYSVRVADWVRLYGDVRSDAAGAIFMSGANAKVNVAEGVQVGSAANSTNVAAVSLTGGGSQIFNAGLIAASIGGGLTVEGQFAQITNTGIIAGTSFGTFVHASSAGLANTGVISCAQGINGFAAVKAWYNDTQIINEGTIASTGADVAAIQVDGFAGIRGVSSLAGMITNYGSITSAGGVGIQVDGVSGIFDYALVNTGIVSGLYRSYQGSGAADRILNAGQMNGDVVLGSGDDLYDGRGGTVNGAVMGGMGNDVFILSDPFARVTEVAGQGHDRIAATVSFDLADTLNVEVLRLLGNHDLSATGNLQDNRIIGNLGANVILGLDGYDVLLGQRGADLLDGGTGEDQLFGGYGADTLQGGDGDDRITGGFGADVMTGGQGADVFLFADARDSRAGDRADTITDFTSGLDRVNLAAIDANETLPGDQALTYIGAQDFDHVAGQVRFAGGVIEVDLDGNGVADMQIILSGAPVLVAHDLSL